MFSTPIVFVIYNRPETTRKVFDVIRCMKPQQLFIIADGAKNEDDEKKVLEAREIVGNIDWDCRLQINFSEINLGCSDRIISGLNWVFNQVESAIILEDDCLPHPAFFKFCENLLQSYEKDEEVMHISGFNVLGTTEISSSYFFSKYVLPPWGWATWKRAWEKFNPQLNTWQQIKHWAYQNFSQEYFKDWTDMFEGARVERKTWDNSWVVDLWKQKALGIIPKHSLVKNIGFNIDATFTKNQETELAKIVSNSLKFPLVHPSNKSAPFEKEIEKKIIEAVRINLD